MDKRQPYLAWERLCWAISLALALNWVVAFLVMYSLGGDGWIGYTAHGSYYLGSHGRYTETSQFVFEYTRFHSAVTWVTFPMMVVSCLVAALLREHRKKFQHDTVRTPVRDAVPAQDSRRSRGSQPRGV